MLGLSLGLGTSQRPALILLPGTIRGRTLIGLALFGAGVLSQPAQSIAGSTVTSTPAFGAGTVAATAAQSITGASFTSEDSFGAGAVARSVQAITGARLTDDDLFGEGGIFDADPQEITGALHAATNAFGGGSIALASTSSQDITGALHDDGDTFGEGSIAGTSVGITGTLYSDADSFGSGSIVVQSVTITGEPVEVGDDLTYTVTGTPLQVEVTTSPDASLVSDESFAPALLSDPGYFDQVTFRATGGTEVGDTVSLAVPMRHRGGTLQSRSWVVFDGGAQIGNSPTSFDRAATSIPPEVHYTENIDGIGEVTKVYTLEATNYVPPPLSLTDETFNVTIDGQIVTSIWGEDEEVYDGLEVTSYEVTPSEDAALVDLTSAGVLTFDAGSVADTTSIAVQAADVTGATGSKTVTVNTNVSYLIVPGDWIEAEAWDRDSNVILKEDETRSGGFYVQNSPSNPDAGTISGEFDGTTSTYNVTVERREETDGPSTYDFRVNDVSVETWDSSGAVNGAWTEYAFQASLADGDSIALVLDGENGAWSATDRIKFELSTQGITGATYTDTDAFGAGTIAGASTYNEVELAFNGVRTVLRTSSVGTDDPSALFFISTDWTDGDQDTGMGLDSSGSGFRVFVPAASNTVIQTRFWSAGGTSSWLTLGAAPAAGARFAGLIRTSLSGSDLLIEYSHWAGGTWTDEDSQTLTGVTALNFDGGEFRLGHYAGGSGGHKWTRSMYRAGVLVGGTIPAISQDMKDSFIDGTTGALKTPSLFVTHLDQTPQEDWYELTTLSGQIVPKNNGSNGQATGATDWPSA